MVILKQPKDKTQFKLHAIASFEYNEWPRNERGSIANIVVGFAVHFIDNMYGKTMDYNGFQWHRVHSNTPRTYTNAINTGFGKM